MINMAFMPLYMWEMWDVTPVTDEHTDSRKVGQYSVWTESAIAQILQLIQSQILAVLSHLCFCRAMFFSSHRINALRSALEKAQQKPTSRAGENIEPFYSKLDIQKGQAFPKNPHYTVIVISRNLLCNKLCALYSMNNMQICATVSGRHFLIFNLSWFE